jgi:DNA-binding LytR/AlgR family response regulator
MLKIAVCDDEKAVCDEVYGILGHKSEYEVTVFDNGTELLTCPQDFDVVILDIEMPEIDGMTAAGSLRKMENANKNAYIIFLTNHEEVMQEAFKVRAFRFFCKLLCPSTLYSTLEEIKTEIYSTVKMNVFSGGVHSMLRLSDVMYLEAYGDGTYIFTKNNVYDTTKPLVYWNKMLDGKGFFQISRFHIVALDKVDSYTYKTVTVKDIDFPLSRFKSKAFQAVLEVIKR